MSLYGGGVVGTVAGLVPVVYLFIVVNNSLFCSYSRRGGGRATVMLPLRTTLSRTKRGHIRLRGILRHCRSGPSSDLGCETTYFLVRGVPSCACCGNGLLRRCLAFFALLRRTQDGGVCPRAVMSSVEGVCKPFSLSSLRCYGSIIAISSTCLYGGVS